MVPLYLQCGGVLPFPANFTPVKNKCWSNASSFSSSSTFGMNCMMKKHQKSATVRVHAFFNPLDDPLLKEALKVSKLIESSGERERERENLISRFRP